jgi:hypothetical protein
MIPDALHYKVELRPSFLKLSLFYAPDILGPVVFEVAGQ